MRVERFASQPEALRLHTTLQVRSNQHVSTSMRAAPPTSPAAVPLTRAPLGSRSCVKALASCGHTLVSTGTVRIHLDFRLLNRRVKEADGAQDERVLVYDLKRRSEYGTLVQHEGPGPPFRAH